MLLALVAARLDWKFRRIPNALTLPALLAGIVGNGLLAGMAGVREALLGTLLGLGILLPLVLLRSLGGGDWKLAGAFGAWLGPGRLLTVLLGSVLVAGVMAMAAILRAGRAREAFRNIRHILAGVLALRAPGYEVSLDNPAAQKIPFAIALAFSVIICGTYDLWRFRSV